MVNRKTVAVIGGGVSGLAAARAFDEQGHRVLGYERTHDIGGVWEPSRSYPGVRTQSPKDFYRYTDMAMPDDYPEWPSGQQVHAYLHSFADKHDLHRLFSLNTGVRSVDRRADGAPGWRLTLESAGRSVVQEVDFVAVCTGQFSDKNIITHPGQDAFLAQGGQVIHSSEYIDPTTVQGKRLVVLGGSKSATDIAVNAVENGAKQVTMVYRHNVWRIPYHIGGINFKWLLYPRFQEVQFNGWGRSPLQKAVAAIAKPFVWANLKGLETMISVQEGLKKHNMKPTVPIDAEVGCTIPLMTEGLMKYVRAGKIKPVIGTYDRYEGDEIVLSNGERVGCDLSVLAVGWKMGFPFLNQDSLDKLIDRDGLYKLYRFCVNPDLPDLGFVGIASSFATVLNADMMAKWLVRFADGQLARQPSDGEMRDNIEMMLNWKRHERPAAQPYGGLCTAPFHLKYFEELLEDIGAKKCRPVYPRAEVYHQSLRAAPDYRAG